MWSKLSLKNLTDHLKHYFEKREFGNSSPKMFKDTHSQQNLDFTGAGEWGLWKQCFRTNNKHQERPPHLILFPSLHLQSLQHRDWDVCTHCWVGGTPIHTSQGQEWLIEPPIARVQCAGQTRGHVLQMTSFNNNVLCSPSLLAPSCSREPSLDGWSSYVRWTWEGKPGARLVEQKNESIWVSQLSYHPEHLHFKRERKTNKQTHILFKPISFGIF